MNQKCSKMKNPICTVVAIVLFAFHLANANETTEKPCPLIKCPSECFSEVGSDGCRTCECPRTCQDANCTADEKCVLEQVVCVREPCFPIPTCLPKNETMGPAIVDVTPCPFDVLCVVGCQRVLGPDGCPTCECPQNCEDTVCSDGYECKITSVSCFPGRCSGFYPICSRITTTTSCPVYLCEPGCHSIRGDDGCDTCACPPTCQDIKCKENEECVLEQVAECFPVPCFPQPICRPLNATCTGSPNTGYCSLATLRWFYNTSCDACQRFQYHGCTPSPNTFLSQKECEGRCRTPPMCGLCGVDCYTLKKRNQRPKCICPNPCKNRCSPDSVCKLREVTCTKEPCSGVESYCDPDTRHSCPFEPICDKRCDYGLQTDEMGCQLCECCDKPID